MIPQIKEQTKAKVDLVKEAYKRFVMSRSSKVDIDGYVNQT